ncbi:MAG: hypothetical protein LBU77_03400, partial [Clostridiales bacterium]|jgi:hypothetical protein|nr:hypothetical protein [Clostridiales bacterium]
MASVVTGFLPVANEEQQARQAAFAAQKQEDLAKIEQLQKDLGEKLTPEQAEKVRESLKKLAENLKEAEDAAETKTALQTAQEELKKAAISAEKDLKALGEALAGSHAPEQFGESQTAENAEALAAAQNQNDAMKNAVDDANAQLSAMSAQNQGQGSDQGEGPGQADGQESVEGQGKGQGAGQGQGQGAGEGEGQGTGGQGGGGSGSGRGTGHIEDEMIYSRLTEGLSDTDVAVGGTQNEGGETMQSEREGFGGRGQSVPYQEVYQTYKSEALQTLEDYDIPQGMRSLIRDYFSTLD